MDAIDAIGERIAVTLLKGVNLALKTINKALARGLEK